MKIFLSVLTTFVAVTVFSYVIVAVTHELVEVLVELSLGELAGILHPSAPASAGGQLHRARGREPFQFPT